MIKKILKFIRNVIIIVLLFGIFTALFDYARMYGGDLPIFCKKEYVDKTKIQKFTGLFYNAERKIRASVNEPLVDSTNIKFTIISYKLDIPRKFREETFEFYLDTTPSVECSGNSELIYADLNIKVYKYCLDDINVRPATDKNGKPIIDYLSKDDSIIEEIASKIAFTGRHKDGSSLMFTTLDHNFASNGIDMIMCNRDNINDVYLLKEGTEMRDEFCTYKDDDFKFICEIFEEDHDDVDNNSDDKDKKVEPETFYEDSEYLYQFDEPKLQYLYITTPEVRGKKETKTPLKTILDSKKLTIDDLESMGLKFNKVKKEVPNS